MSISKPFFVRPLDFTIYSSVGAVSGYPASNLNRRKEMGLIFKSANALSASIVGDLGAAQSIDFFALISTNAQSSSTHSLYLGNDPAVLTSSPVFAGSRGLIDPAITRSDGLYHSHYELPATYSARYFQIGFSGHTGEIDVAAIVIGKKITPSHFYNLDYEMGVQDTGALDFGRFGVMDETPGKYLRTIDFTLGWSSRAEFETSFRPMMEELGMRGIVYFCMRPDADVYRQANTYLGVMKKPGFAKGIRKPETFTQEFSLISLI